MKKLKISATVTAILGILGILSTGYLFLLFAGKTAIPLSTRVQGLLVIFSFVLITALILSTLITMGILLRYLRKSDRILNMPLVSDINK